MSLKILIVIITISTLSVCSCSYLGLGYNPKTEISNRVLLDEQMYLSDSLELSIELSDSIVSSKEWKGFYELFLKTKGLVSKEFNLPFLNLSVYNKSNVNFLIPYKDLSVNDYCDGCAYSEVSIIIGKGITNFNDSIVVTSGAGAGDFISDLISPMHKIKIPRSFPLFENFPKIHPDTGRFWVYAIYRNNIHVDTTNIVWRGKIFSDTVWFNVIN